MSGTVILGGSRTNPIPAGTLAPALGGPRSELGATPRWRRSSARAAIGRWSYLGKDPKIGRVVAIKTMALSQEFEATSCRG